MAINSIQSGVVSVPIGSITVNISSINTSKAFLKMPNFGGKSAYIYGQIISSTQIQFTCTDAGSTCSWEVVEYA